MAWFAGPSLQRLFSTHAFPWVAGLCPAQRVGCTAEEVICSSHPTHPAGCPGVGLASAWEWAPFSILHMAPDSLGAACTGPQHGEHLSPGRLWAATSWCPGGLVDGSTLSPQGSGGEEQSAKSLLLSPQEGPEGKLRLKGQNRTLRDPSACTAHTSVRSLDPGVPAHHRLLTWVESVHFYEPRWLRASVRQSEYQTSSGCSLNK